MQQSLVQDYPAAGLDASKIYYQNDASAFAQAASDGTWHPCRHLCDLARKTWIASHATASDLPLGVAPMQGIHEALNAMRDAAVWSERRARINTARPAPLFVGVPFDAPKMLTEDAGKSWLSAQGINMPEGRCVSAKDAGQAAAAVGYPVALKMMSPLLAHKTEAGAVALNIKDAQALESAFKRHETLCFSA